MNRRSIIFIAAAGFAGLLAMASDQFAYQIDEKTTAIKDEIEMLRNEERLLLWTASRLHSTSVKQRVESLFFTRAMPHEWCDHELEKMFTHIKQLRNFLKEDTFLDLVKELDASSNTNEL